VYVCVRKRECVCMCMCVCIYVCVEMLLHCNNAHCCHTIVTLLSQVPKADESDLKSRAPFTMYPKEEGRPDAAADAAGEVGEEVVHPEPPFAVYRGDGTPCSWRDVVEACGAVEV
jgi:hypothetical protein